VYPTPTPQPHQVHVRRGGPDVQDPALNSHSKINCITACIQVRVCMCCCCHCTGHQSNVCFYNTQTPHSTQPNHPPNRTQAAKAGADEGLMLDPNGFVATCNSTNFAIVRRGEVSH